MPTAHRTITGIDGGTPPLAAASHWAVNPGKKKARFYFDLAIRGTTGYGDEPAITFRPWVRNGSLIAAGEPVVFGRPRLRDHTSIKFQHTTDAGVSYTDSSASVIDNNSATVATLNSLDTAANGDWVVIGGPQPFSGVAIDVVLTNSNAVAATLEYWNGSAWTALSNVVDGTMPSATTFVQDGQITWAIPTDWAQSTINGITAYWVRYSVAGAMDATVTVAECDLLFSMQVAVDVDVDGDDATVMLEEISSASGTVVISGSSQVSWR